MEPFDKDPRGFFVISIENGEMVVQHRVNDGRASNYALRGKRAQHICRRIINENLISKQDHAAYIGMELARAEECLKSGKAYVQDEAWQPRPSKPELERYKNCIALSHSVEALKEHCGVFGAYSCSGANVTPVVLNGLMALQNRGQESWGIAIDGNNTYKKAGLVYYGYHDDKKRIDSIRGSSGTGHVRYSTVGSSEDLGSFHPIDIDSTCIRIAHNGTISNVAEMRSLLRKAGIEAREGATDTELAGRLLSKFFIEKNDWVSAFARFDAVKNGSYCIVIQTPTGEVVAARDSRGYKPLCYGHHAATDSFLVASESHALENEEVGAKVLGDIEPGQLVILSKKGLEFHRFADRKERSLDTFEIAYFAHHTSKIDGIQVAIARKNIGREMFRKFGRSGDIVVPIPESAYHAASGYSLESGIGLEIAFGKDRYSRRSVLRGFIQPNEREAVARGMSLVGEMVAGKSVIVVDDSIVRGTSSEVFIDMLKRADAREISLMSTFPPIRFPCYMGIDHPSHSELIAYREAAGEALEGVGAKVAEKLGIAFVGYMDPLSISRAIGVPVGSLCFSCVTGDYSKLNFTPQISSRVEIKQE